jgi:chromosome segregation ATPase
MTSTRYYVARFAQAFGYFRRNQRRADAASEMHLLREAEAQLGTAVWTKVEDIEALSVEYWNLRRFLKERAITRDKLAECQGRLDQAHEERSNVLNNTPEDQQDLLDERIRLLTRLEELAFERDRIVAEAREVRRSYDGLKMKLEVISAESQNTSVAQQEITTVKERLLQLKKSFGELKDQRIAIGQEIEKGDVEVDSVDEKVKETRQSRRVSASEAFLVIGDGNKEISTLRAESGVLDTQMRQLYAEIGRYVSRNAYSDPSCAAAVSEHRGLVDVMRAIRRSIALNHQLAGNT